MTTKTKRGYTYEDINKYSWCWYNGRYGWVLDKGDHLSSAVGRHIQIDFHDKETPSTMKLHENLVNKYLRRGDTLWIGFGKVLYPYQPD